MFHCSPNSVTSNYRATSIALCRLSQLSKQQMKASMETLPAALFDDDSSQQTPLGAH